MQARVRLYAGLREKAKKSELEVEASALGEAVTRIKKILEGEEVQVLLNGRNAEALPQERKLKKTDRLEAFPPVGGG